MGDRANVVIDEEQGGTIYLYTHWGGSELPATLQTALKKRWRWDDEPYLARLIFQEMTRGSENNETGFGISTTPQDNEHPYLRVSVKAQTVTVDYGPVRQHTNHPNRVIPFEEYIKIPDIEWDALPGCEPGTADFIAG